MIKPKKITLIFIIIFLLGLIGVIAYVNVSLDTAMEEANPGIEKTEQK